MWRELKRLGALQIQPGGVRIAGPSRCTGTPLDKVRERIEEFGGENMIFMLTGGEERVHQTLVESFRENSAKEYAEIVEECETKFFKEIGFERFRENYTFEERRGDPSGPGEAAASAPQGRRA
ncbi:Chromate resistance protein ChrB [Microtetraspora fusca]|uniref:Chromate resistance protein ChrB n=1 Tax=Microtetraspora fusca TaxID=1997 RepID=UPI0027E3E3BC|nr:Chromate resistance protein ChrB [Microtetraspora fusca]